MAINGLKKKFFKKNISIFFSLLQVNSEKERLRLKWGVGRLVTDTARGFQDWLYVEDSQLPGGYCNGRGNGLAGQVAGSGGMDELAMDRRKEESRSASFTDSEYMQSDNYFRFVGIDFKFWYYFSLFLLL